LAPPLLVGMLVPGVFIRALGFAGLILTIIAIFLPIYLLNKADKMPIKKVFYQCTTYKSLRIFVFAIGIIVVLCELRNVFC
jgi:tyrosine-specific transport protein